MLTDCSAFSAGDRVSGEPTLIVNCVSTGAPTPADVTLSQARRPVELHVTGKATTVEESTSPPCNCKAHVPHESNVARSDATNEVRRLFPPPYHRPNLLVVAGRWWFEILLAEALVVVGATAVHSLGAAGAAVSGVVVSGGITAAATQSDLIRTMVRSVYQRCIVPHRVRAGLLEAGVRNHRGRLPTIVRSQCRPDQARLWLHLPAGILGSDVHAANDVIAASCGAAGVAVLPDGVRRDRILLVVLRPRWGWPPRLKG